MTPWFVLLTALAAPVIAGSSDTAAACERRLQRTLAEMERRPLLKEEHATALMWLRLDAAEALSVQDVERCARSVSQVERLLGLGDEE